MTEVGKSDLLPIKYLIDNKDYTAAGSALTSYLAENHRDEDAWFLLGRLLIEQDNPALAKLVLEYTTARKGAKRWQDWYNLGTAFDHLCMHEEAEGAYRKSLSLDPDNIHVLPALATCMVMQYRSEEAIEMCDRSIAINPDGKHAVSTKGFAYIQLRDYANGWDNYEAGYGKLRWRNERLYCGEGRWDGTLRKEQRVLVHGEQGIGDQIAGLEPLSDMADNTTVLAVEVDAKLEALVQRSYPDLEVHGTLQQKDLEWPLRFKDKITAHTGLFTLHRHLRRGEDAYPGKPYLTADPQRRIQWRALLDSFGPEPKIGLAWSGGVSLTQRSARRARLEQWIPILKQPAHWVSLEYKDRSADIERIGRQRQVTIHDWPRATRNVSYEETAALVAELDLVICVPTAVVHLAGALGVPVFCLVHPRPNLHYTGSGTTIPYYGDRIRMFRRETADDWKASVREVANALEDWIDARAAA
jgi:tetratricopeptide (TPR) repeat protein